MRKCYRVHRVSPETLSITLNQGASVVIECPRRRYTYAMKILEFELAGGIQADNNMECGHQK